MLDKKKPAVAILTDLINLSNRNNPKFKEFDYLDLSFRDLRAIGDSDKHNTEIEVTSAIEPNPSDWRTIYYTRIPITHLVDINQHGTDLPDKPNYHTAHDMLPEINAKYGVCLNRLDIEPALVVREAKEEDGSVWIAIRAKPSALIVTGGFGIRLVDVLPEDKVTPVES